MDEEISKDWTKNKFRGSIREQLFFSISTTSISSIGTTIVTTRMDEEISEDWIENKFTGSIRNQFFYTISTTSISSISSSITKLFIFSQSKT
jgi:spore maturation protein SpmA